MSTTSEAIFKKRLSALRVQRDINQEQLALKAGLPATAVSHFERGTRRPSFDNLRKLADALEVSVDYLMGRTENQTSNFGQDAEIARHYENMTENDRELARDFMARLADRGTKN